eukprot:scaffold4574_cov143-Isochrysis_galbana.AAC.8
MAPLQLRLEPTEVVSAMNKGAARVRVDSTDGSSLQVHDSAPARHPGARPEPAQRTAGVSPVHWPELRLLAWVVSAAKTPLGVAAPPHYYHSKKLSTTTPFGVFQIPVGVPTHSLNSNSCPRQLTEPTALTIVHPTNTFTCSTQMGVSDSGPPNLSAS